MTNTRNPLPKADLNSQSQRKSIVSFQNVLPVDLFVFRDERVDDAGVDGSLETLIDGHYTNMRAQIQLKSRQEKNAKQDGSVMLPIETSNFNYLLNGSLGLYVLYVEETDELFYAWADDENHRRIEIKSDWKNNETISIPLQELTQTALITIYDKIRKRAKLHRETSEALAHAPSNDNISISINPETLESENSVEIEEILSSTGMTLVSAGYSNRVLKKLSLVSQKAIIEPRFRLINAYAHYATGRYQIASGLVVEAIISGGLMEEDRKFAERLHLGCKRNLGEITEDQYYQEAEAKASEDEILSAETRLQHLVVKFRSQITRDEMILSEIQDLKNKIITSDKAPNSTKLGVRVRYLEVMGFDLVRRISSEIFMARTRRRVNYISVPLNSQVSDLKTSFRKSEEWNEEATSLVRDAIKVNHPIFEADALATTAYIGMIGLLSKITVAELDKISNDQTSIQNDTLLILDLCDKAWRIYKQADIIEGEVRTQLIMAQVFEIMGQTESAKNLATGVIGKANYLRYKRHVETATDILSDNTLFFRIIQGVHNLLRQNESGEYNLSNIKTNEDIQDFANFIIETFKIPNERRENVIIDIQCTRDIGRERMQWCRHIEVHQNLMHTFSPTTHYAKNPNRQVVCSKLGHLVDNLLPDWVSQIEEFKKTYCSICSEREPINIAINH